MGISMSGKGQTIIPSEDTINAVFENDHLKVTEYVSSPGKDICGIGLHSHPAHLSILLTDVNVKVTSDDGITQNFDLKAGTMFWSEPETHMAINNGNKTAKVYLVVLK